LQIANCKLRIEGPRVGGLIAGLAAVLPLSIFNFQFSICNLQSALSAPPLARALPQGSISQTVFLPGPILAAGGASSQPATTAPVGADRVRLKRLAWQVVMIASVVLVLAMAALALWVMHWGRQLKKRGDGDAVGSHAASPDPWKTAAERMDTPPADDQEKGPLG
jgi:hypothetical protein